MMSVDSSCDTTINLSLDASLSIALPFFGGVPGRYTNTFYRPSLFTIERVFMLASDFNVAIKKAFWCILLLLPSLVSAENMPSWNVTFPSDQNWHVGFEREQADQYIIEWVRDDDTVEDWNELITFMYQQIPQSMYNAVVNEIIDGLQQDCPSFGAELLGNADDSITIEWWDDGCGGWPAQRVVVKFVYAGNGILSLQYAHYVNDVQPDIDHWRQFVLMAKPTQ